MPKEITYDEVGAFLLMPDGNEYPEGFLPPEASRDGGKFRRRGVEVRWSKIGLADIRGPGHVELGAASFDLAQERPSDGVWVKLDRDGLNRLIRSLQKAGRDAFGTDAWAGGR